MRQEEAQEVAAGRRFRAFALSAGLAALACGLLAASAAANITLAPNNQDFGSQQVGSTSSPVTFTLTVTCYPDPAQVPPNPPACNADHPLTPNVTVTGDFEVRDNTCTQPMPGNTPSGTSCTFKVVFVPATTGERTGIVDVGDSVGFGRAAVRGTGTPLPVAAATPAKKCKKGQKLKKGKCVKKKRKKKK